MRKFCKTHQVRMGLACPGEICLVISCPVDKQIKECTYDCAHCELWLKSSAKTDIVCPRYGIFCTQPTACPISPNYVKEEA